MGVQCVPTFARLEETTAISDFHKLSQLSHGFPVCSGACLPFVAEVFMENVTVLLKKSRK